MDISIVCPKFNISLVKYNVLEASFKKVKIWVTVWLWPKHKLLCSLYFSFVMHGWCDQTSSIYYTIHWKVTCYDSIVDEPPHNKIVTFWQFFGNFLTLKIYFCCNFLLSQNKIVIFWRKCYGKKLHHLGHKFKVLGSFLSISTIFYNFFANWL
jgi:hypothetical protein